ncbi:hypothetical protein BKA70DRAFT_472225 [Coprinopsis sp. MPI-PUGE-AT-0042]|nr:hypothetical protein BKA70DRAFT_472225 [Coprinopsis sp. MPI-PUGE-AT-0042]
MTLIQLDAGSCFPPSTMPLEPPLPVELWGEILREATVGFHPQTPWILPSVTPLQYRRWRMSMLVKRRIVLVCRQWYSLGIPLLHEHIILKQFRYEGTRAFAKSLSRSSSIDHTLGPLGRFTKRLDIAYPNGTVTPSACFPLSSLLRNLPNLLAFTIQTNAFPMREILLTSLPPTLEYFEWQSTPDPVHEATLYLLFESHPRLQFARIPSFFEGAVSPGKVPVQPSTPLLACQQLCITNMDVDGSPTFSSLPPLKSSLKSLGIQDIWDSERAISSFQLTINAWGCGITSLFLDFAFLESPVIQQHVRYSLERCPSLHTLFVTTAYSSDWLFPKVPNNRIKLLGVRFNEELTTTVCNDLLNMFRDAKGKFPELKVIRLFDERNIIHLRKNHAGRCRRVIEGLKGEGQILFQDHFERELIF